MSATVNVLDSSGNGNTGVWSSTQVNQVPFATPPPTRWLQPGPYLSGAHNYSVFAPSFLVSPSGTTFASNGAGTWEAWLYYINDVGGTFTGIFANAGGFNLSRAFMILHAANPNNLATASGGSASDHVFSYLTHGSWIHFAARMSAANTWDVFKNGSLVASGVPGDGGGDRIFLGFNDYFNGYMAAVGYWRNVSLTNGQIATHYAANTTHDDCKAAILADSPDGLWMMDDGTPKGWSLSQIGMG